MEAKRPKQINKIVEFHPIYIGIDWGKDQKEKCPEEEDAEAEDEYLGVTEEAVTGETSTPATKKIRGRI